jgi:hypothetical protein
MKKKKDKGITLKDSKNRGTEILLLAAAAKTEHDRYEPHVIIYLSSSPKTK